MRRNSGTGVSLGCEFIMRKNITSYAVTAVCGLALFAVILVLHGFADAETLADRYRIICDALTIPAVIMIMVGLLILIANMGALDGISYSIRGIGRQFVPFLRLKNETFYDYVQRKKEKRKQREYKFVFIVGAAFLALAVVFLVLFEVNYRG